MTVDLHDPMVRATVIIGLLSKASMEDMTEFDKLMAEPTVTPSEDRINDPKDPVWQKGLHVDGGPGSGYALTFGYFAGIGCMLMYSTPGGTDIWVDPLPGPGLLARKSYLENSVKLFYGDRLEVMESNRMVVKHDDATAN